MISEEGIIKNKNYINPEKSGFSGQCPCEKINGGNS